MSQYLQHDREEFHRSLARAATDSYRRAVTSVHLDEAELVLARRFQLGQSGKYRRRQHRLQRDVAKRPVVTKSGRGFAPLLSFVSHRTVKERDRSDQPRRNTVSDQLYLLIQGWLIIVLTVLDGGEVLIQHPVWFQ